MNSKALGATAFTGSQATTLSSNNTSVRSRQRGLFARLNDALGLGALGLVPADRTADTTGAPVPIVMDEKFFAKEAEAQAYASLLMSHGYQVTVARNAYDYMWSVEVYAADEESAGS